MQAPTRCDAVENSSDYVAQRSGLVLVVVPCEGQNVPAGGRQPVPATSVIHERVSVVAPPDAVQLDAQTVGRIRQVDLSDEVSIGSVHPVLQNRFRQAGLAKQVTYPATPVAQRNPFVVSALVEHCPEPERAVSAVARMGIQNVVQVLVTQAVVTQDGINGPFESRAAPTRRCICCGLMPADRAWMRDTSPCCRRMSASRRASLIDVLLPAGACSTALACTISSS